MTTLDAIKEVIEYIASDLNEDLFNYNDSDNIEHYDHTATVEGYLRSLRLIMKLGVQARTAS